MATELSKELIISQDKVKEFIQKMTPSKRKSLDKQFLGGIQWDHANAKAQVAQQLFQELLKFHTVEIHENFS